MPARQPRGKRTRGSTSGPRPKPIKAEIIGVAKYANGPFPSAVYGVDDGIVYRDVVEDWVIRIMLPAVLYFGFFECEKGSGMGTCSLSVRGLLSEFIIYLLNAL